MNGESYNGYGYNEDGTERERDDLEANEFSSNDTPSDSTLESYDEVQKQEEREYEKAENKEYQENIEKALEKVREVREEMADVNKELDKIESGIRSMIQNIGAQSLTVINEANSDADASTLQNPPKEKHEDFAGYGIAGNGLVAKREKIIEMDNK